MNVCEDKEIKEIKENKENNNDSTEILEEEQQEQEQQETSEDYKKNLEKDIEEISQKLNEQENKSKEYLSLLQRTQADFQNYKKRMQKENEEYTFISNQKIIIEFLKFRETLKQAYSKENNNTLKKNLSQLLINFDNILKRLNIKKIDCLNEDFDYNLCECVLRKPVTNKKEHNKVIEILEDGYLLNNKLITPAKVVVGAMEE